MSAPAADAQKGTQASLPPAKVFISYRRDDTRSFSLLIADRLTLPVGEENLFIDVKGIALGQDFHELLKKRIQECDIFLAVVGKGWHANRRLFELEDYPRMEVLHALQGGVAVLPIFAEGARSPPWAEVPEELHSLLKVNGPAIDPDAGFDHSMRELVATLEQLARARGKRLGPLPPPAGDSVGRRRVTRLQKVIGVVVGLCGALSVAWFAPWRGANSDVANDAGSGNDSLQAADAAPATDAAAPYVDAQSAPATAVSEAAAKDEKPEPGTPSGKGAQKTPGEALLEQLKAVASKSGKKCTVTVPEGGSPKVNCCGRDTVLGSDPSTALRALKSVLKGLGDDCLK